MPTRRSERIGLRLWGIALEPFWPARNGSMTSPISVCWRLRTSVAKRSIDPPVTASVVRNAACRSRGHDLGADRLGREAQLGQHLRLDGRLEMAVGAHRAADLAHGQPREGGPQALPVAVELEGPARELQAERRRLGVDAVGAAHHQRGAVLAGAGDDRRHGRVEVRQEPLARRAQLEGQGGVDDIAAGQAQVQVAARRADRLGDLADEGDDVVIGGALDLGDAGHVDARRGLERGEGVAGDEAPSGLRPGHRQLDQQHRLEAGLVRPQGAHLRQRVARDHRPTPAATRPMSRRRWAPANVTWPAAAYAASAAAARSRPRPTTVRTRPPAVRRPSSGAFHARGEDQAARGTRLRQAADGVAALRPLGVARRREDDRHRRLGGGREDRARRQAEPGRGGRQPALRGGRQERPERHGQAGQDGLRLGIAEADVELEQPRALVGEHQAGVEDAAEGDPATGRLRQDGGVDGRRGCPRPPRRRGRATVNRRPCRRCWDPRRRRPAACGHVPPAAPAPPSRRRGP